jgi:hypothetical protein
MNRGAALQLGEFFRIVWLDAYAVVQSQLISPATALALLRFRLQRFRPATAEVGGSSPPRPTRFPDSMWRRP